MMVNKGMVLEKEVFKITKERNIMINTMFKVVGIIASLAVIIAVLLLFLLNFEQPKGNLLSKNAQSKAVMKVTKAEKDGNKILFLLKIKNGSDERLFLHGLVINILDKNNEVVDKCRLRGSEAVPLSISPTKESTVKVICSNMQFAAEFTGKVNYDLIFEEAF